MEKNLYPIFVCFILSVILFVVFIILGVIRIINPASNLIPPEYVIFFLPILPGMMYSDIIFIYLFPILIFCIFFAISPLLIQMLFKINKISFTFRKKPDYGFLELNKQIKPSRIFYRALILSLFIYSTPVLVMHLLNTNPRIFRIVIGGDPGLKDLYIAEATFFGTFFLSSFCFILFLPIWLLEDCGLILYRTFPNQRRTPIIEGVYNSYFKVLETYTGITTLYAYIRQIYLTLQVFELLPPFDPSILTPLILLFLPFILTGILAIPIYFYEKLLPRSLKRIHSRLSKYNLPHFKLPELKELLKKSTE